MHVPPAPELPAPESQFLCDEHIPYSVLAALTQAGLDVQHVVPLGLQGIADPALLRVAADGGRILLTRNYRDFAPLVAAWNRDGQDFPGVLFYSTSIRPTDVAAHVRSLTAWLDGPRQIANTYGWLA